MFGFVGSTATGEAITRSAGIKKLLLELGGNGPIVVMDDADLDAAAAATTYSAYYTSGQVCTASERVLVHRDIHDDFVNRVVALSEKVVAGDPLNPNTTMGPMCFPGSFDKTRAHLEDAVAKGATLVFGGGFNGLYHEPTVLTGVTSQMLVAQEETFGPVVPVMSFAGVEEAITIANETPYGLQGAVFTSSIPVAWRLAEGIDCGTVHVNGTTNHWELLAPFGGMKKSGIGRILGVASPTSFTNQKQITFDVN
jgi:acyl-CoA reductase-like NAD-dependent aldehyde dehydrogenase